MLNKKLNNMKKRKSGEMNILEDFDKGIKIGEVVKSLMCKSDLIISAIGPRPTTAALAT